MYLPRNTFVFVVVFFRQNYVAAVLKALNITLRDLEMLNKTYLRLPDLEIAEINSTAKYNDVNFRQKVKRMYDEYDEIEVVQQARDMPAKKIFGLYTKFWTDLLVPSYRTLKLYPIQIGEMFKRIYLRLKES